MLFRSDRKSTRLNSSHTLISYAVFCLKKKKVVDRKSTRLNSSHTPISYDVFCLKKHVEPAPDVLVLDRLVVGGSPDAPPASRRHSSSFLTGLWSAVRQPRAFQPGILFFNDTATTEIYTLSLHDALPI